VAASLLAHFCTSGRGGSCHGWFVAGFHFRFFTEIGAREYALRAADKTLHLAAALVRPWALVMFIL
jgi:hypothetical protein